MCPNILLSMVFWNISSSKTKWLTPGRNHMQWIKKLGNVETSDGSIFDYEIKATISQKHGRCFKMILKPLQDILFAYLLVRVEMNKSVISKPEKLKVRK